MTKDERKRAKALAETRIEESAKKLIEAADDCSVGRITYAKLLSVAAARLRDAGVHDLHTA